MPDPNAVHDLREEGHYEVCQLCDQRQAVLVVGPAKGQNISDTDPGPIRVCAQCNLDLVLPTSLDYGLIDKVTEILQTWLIEQVARRTHGRQN